MNRVKRGDIIEVTAGKDKGFRGDVIRVITKENRVVVNGINMMKRHEKERQAGNQQVPAQIVDFEAPLDLSNVMPVCPACDQKTRVGYRYTDGGFKTRFCKKCNADMD